MPILGNLKIASHPFSVLTNWALLYIFNLKLKLRLNIY